jgi:hypothetical protein
MPRFPRQEHQEQPAAQQGPPASQHPAERHHAHAHQELLTLAEGKSHTAQWKLSLLVSYAAEHEAIMEEWKAIHADPAVEIDLTGLLADLRKITG